MSRHGPVLAEGRRPKYLAIRRELEARIADGRLPAGSRLPSQRELADAFGVTLMTLRQALALLEADGLLVAKKGSGTYVAAPEDAALPPKRHFGEEGGRLDYGTYLRVPELLDQQRCLTDAHDELLFVVVHQVYELWFKQLLFELEAARDRMDADDAAGARRCFRRVRAVEQVMLQHVEVLETMTPQDFLAFRSELAPASGFQSVQFREIEFLSGSKDPAYLGRISATPDERARLERRLAEPSLWDAFVGLLARRGSPSVLEVLRDRERHGDLFDLSEALLDHDQAFALWRARHVSMVERQIGRRSGTGGSTGAEYLRTTLDRRFYPALWDVRAEL